MNVSLTRELESYIQEKVESGMYQTASEVVREALRGMHEREVAELKRKIKAGLEQIERGETVPFTEELLQRIMTGGS